MLSFTLEGEGPDLNGGSHVDVVGTIMRGLFCGRACDVEGVVGESGGGDGAANGVDVGANGD